MDNKRRQFLKQMVALSVASGLYTYSDINALASSLQKGELPKRPFGKTGYNIGIYSLGAQATIEQLGREDDAAKIINKCIDMGINYIDTAAAYGEDKGKWIGDVSEKNVGNVMKTRRQEVFLATKTHDRSYDGSMRLLEKSLKNLQTDQIDLWQIHNIKSKEKENFDEIFGDKGVVKAMEKARSEGMVRFVGFTGHTDPGSMKIMTERYNFDTVLMAINAADKFYNSFIENLLPVVVEKEMGIVGMKIPARDRIFSKGGIITMKEAMSYVLSLPVSTIIVGLDNVRELEENIKIAKEFAPLNEDELLAIEEKVKPHYEHLQFFKGLSEWPKEWGGNNM